METQVMRFYISGASTVRIFEQVGAAGIKKNVSIRVQNESPNAVRLVAGSSFNLDVAPCSASQASGDHVYFELTPLNSAPAYGWWIIDVI